MNITKRAALAAFGGRQSALAEALGLSYEAVRLWHIDAPIPRLRAFELREKFPDHFRAKRPAKKR